MQAVNEYVQKRLLLRGMGSKLSCQEGAKQVVTRAEAACPRGCSPFPAACPCLSLPVPAWALQAHTDVPQKVPPCHLLLLLRGNSTGSRMPLTSSDPLALALFMAKKRL